MGSRIFQCDDLQHVATQAGIHTRNIFAGRFIWLIMKGYAKLGLLMGDFPEVAIFRKFAALSAQNILYLQAELRNLEVDLRKFAAEDDASTNPDRKTYSLDWFALQDSGEDTAEEGNDGQQWHTVLEIRKKLEIYQEALLRHREILKIGGPTRRDLNFLNRWMQRTNMGNVYLYGEDKDIWSNPDWEADLLSLRSRAADDAFFHWVYETVIHWYHQILGRHIEKPRGDEHLAGTIVYEELKIMRWTRVVTTTLACVLPVLSIAVLYTVQSMSGRLGIMAALTAVFAFCLVLTTNAGMADIFAATAAYAAVQVVFIGTSTVGNNTSSTS